MKQKDRNRRIAIGCGVAGCLALVALALALVLARSGGAAFLKFGIGTDLAEYTSAVRKADLDPVKRDHLVDAIDEVRSSLDRQNNFGFFQWLEIDSGVQSILGDGAIDDSEYDSLLAEIARMKKIQGIVDE